MITLVVPVTDPDVGRSTVDRLMLKAGMAAYPVIVTDKWRNGYTSTVNRGLAYAMRWGTDACVCVDDVAPVTDDWLVKLKSGLDLSPHIWFAGPSGPCRTPPQSMGYPNDTRLPKLVSHVAGFCLLISYEALKHVGFLTAHLEHYGSDVDYQWRARQRGGRSVWVPQVYVDHALHTPRQPDWDRDNERFNSIWR